MNREAIEISVVIPCLNEAATVGVCVDKALQAFKDNQVTGEVVICDNGSTDGSDVIAKERGARVVHEVEKGYGRAYLRGLDEAKGKFFVLGDADNTYDFAELKGFIEPLRAGIDFVNGTRLKGKIHRGAMPWLHQYFGNPFLTWFLNLIYGAGVSDVYCGMKSMTREAYQRIRPISTGMEFALELIINAARRKLSIREVPIVYHPRGGGHSKLRTFSDGWRSLRFMLIFSPTHLFLIPGGILLVFGLFFLFSLLPGPMTLFGHFFNLHAMIFGSFLCMIGSQVLSLGLLAKTYALSEKFDTSDPFIRRFYQLFNLQKGMVVGFILCFLGVILNFLVFFQWVLYGPLPRERILILAYTFLVVGGQVIFTSLFGSLLGLSRRKV